MKIAAGNTKLTWDTLSKGGSGKKNGSHGSSGGLKVLPLSATVRVLRSYSFRSARRLKKAPNA